MPLPKVSSLASLTNDPAWQEHAANFEKAFAKMNMRQLLKLHNWEAQYLPESRDKIPVAFYMFSGPDFLYVDQFFPKADVYILCGKESMGPPPDPLRIANLGAALHNLEEEMQSSLRFSFFITKDMKVSLDSQELKGVLPILYVFLARADKSIRDVTYGSLSGGGSFQPGRGGSNSGVRIQYIDNQSGQQQTLYYFTTDISDGGLGSSGFLKFCSQFGAGCSLLKASSYLMFESGFNRIRDFILDHSKTIVQDDAGIPISYFNRDKWNIRVFGNYKRPDRNFQTTLSAEIERDVRPKRAAADRIQLWLPLELQREPGHRGHAALIIPGSGGTRNTGTRRRGNRSPNAAGSLRGAVSRSDNDRPLFRSVAASNELVLHNNRAAPASVDRGEIADQTNSERDVVQVIAVDVPAVDLSPPPVPHFDLAVAGRCAVADHEMIREPVLHPPKMPVVIIERGRVSLPRPAVVDHDVLPAAARDRRANRSGRAPSW